ncbi:HNH endonuclease [Microcystis aeruginosa]|nr:HNH endonuclease [Microcystis aeruginosa]
MSSSIVPHASAYRYISNLQTLCLSCNRRKKDHLDPRFRRYFQ